jgi:hypothetical protein
MSQLATGEGKMEAVVDVIEQPEVIVERLNDGKVHSAVRNVIWFSTLTERNRFAKPTDHTFETMHDGRVLFGVEHLSLLD